MKPASYLQCDALALAELVRRKELSPSELLDCAIANAAAINPKLNCIAHTHYAAARAQIAAGLSPGAFHGVPFIVKDLGIELAGTITSAGSKAFSDRIAPCDSELVSRYKRAGLVIFAKSTSPELGLTYTTESQAFGATRNPWNLQRSAGGSSAAPPPRSPAASCPWPTHRMAAVPYEYPPRARVYSA